MDNKRKILMTAALPYANGSIHLGHMVEYIQADIWARFQKLRGHECLFVCADDAHGTPIMISAEKQGISPEALIEKIHSEHERDLADFYVAFDNFYTTHSDENKALASFIYQSLEKNGDIVKREIQQAYDEDKEMFLPDRYVRGECPGCGKDDQYGDNCEACGATYTPEELKNPVSTLSGKPPIYKKSLHYFFKLSNYQDMLKKWVKAGHIHEAVTNKLLEWFDSDLQDWDISRDKPYFGFEIPDTSDKYFYVWLDAPVGYMASFKNLCARSNLNFDEYWSTDSKAELHHFVGKDIIYFHALFWPAMLSGSNFRLPTKVHTHGFLTVNGQKMSKSRGTFINARDYLEHLNPEALRYYFAAKLGAGVEDIDFNFEDFTQRVNSDLVGKVVNIASRCAGFITKKFDGTLAGSLSEPTLYHELVDAGDEIAEFYENREYSHAVRTIMKLADRINQYIDEQKPWVLAKEEGREQDVQSACSMGINAFRILMTYLKPILPKMAEASESFLNVELSWGNRQDALLGHNINKFKPLMQRIDSEKVALLS